MTFYTLKAKLLMQERSKRLEAKKLLREAVNICKKCIGPQNKYTCYMIGSLAELNYQLAFFGEALKLNYEGLSMTQRRLRGNNKLATVVFDETEENNIDSKFSNIRL